MTHKQLTILLATKVMKATIAQYNAESLLTQREQVGYWKKNMIHWSHMDQIWLVVSGGLKASKASRTTHRFFFNAPGRGSSSINPVNQTRAKHGDSTSWLLNLNLGQLLWNRSQWVDLSLSWISCWFHLYWFHPGSHHLIQLTHPSPLGTVLPIAARFGWRWKMHAQRGLTHFKSTPHWMYKEHQRTTHNLMVYTTIYGRS